MSGQLFNFNTRVVDDKGTPISGGMVYLYQSGGDTLQAGYSDAALTAALSNPCFTDSTGLLPTIYLDNSKSYRAKITDSFGIVIRDIDPVNISLTGEVGANTIGYNNTYPYDTGTVGGSLKTAEDDITSLEASVATMETTVAGVRSVPTGAVFHFASNTAPLGYLVCDGSAVSRTAYADLYAITGTVFGTGDGSTTFNLPDLRAEFIRGWDNGRGVDSGRGFGSSQEDSIEAHKHKSGWGSDLSAPFGSNGTTYGSSSYYDPGKPAYLTSDGSESGTNTSGVISTETRPKNVALLPCIKT